MSFLGRRSRRRALLAGALAASLVGLAALLAVIAFADEVDPGVGRSPVVASRIPRPRHGKHRPSRRRGHASARRRRHDPAYRWLVRTAGAPPSIAAENRAPGSRGWQLPGPRADVGGRRWGRVSGYVATQALFPGQVEQVYVSAPGAHRVRIDVYRIGWYRGTGGRAVLASRPLPVGSQPPCAHLQRTGLTECQWRATLGFRIPAALPSGVYIAKLSARTGQSDCLFVVLAARPEPLLVQLPTATYEAYNAWGGDSLYPGGADRAGLTGSTQGVAVSYQRPYDSDTGAGQFFARDVAFVRFAERYGYPVTYTTSESVAADPAELAGHRALIDLGHDEYWSRGEVAAWRGSLVRHHTSLLFLSSDTLGWRVRFTPPGPTIVAYKEFAALDPDRADPTGPFLPARGAELTGSAYLGCITPRLPGAGPPRYRYFRWAPAPGLSPHWLFARTGITPLTTIPGVVGYELDQRSPFTPRGTRLIGGGVAPCMGAVGELGEPRPGPGEDRADTTLATTPSGAVVFDAGTLGWELGLDPIPSASPDAPVRPEQAIVAMTRNLLDHVLDRRR